MLPRTTGIAYLVIKRITHHKKHDKLNIKSLLNNNQNVSALLIQADVDI
jgi:hypothetical protein